MKRVLIALTVLVLIAAAAGGVVYRRVITPYKGYADAEQFVDVPAGAGMRGIEQRLVAAGVVRDAITFRMALWRSGAAKRLKAGEYRFDQAMTPADVIGKIARGEVYVINVMFPEGLTVGEMSKIFEAHGFGPAASFADAARNVALVRDLDPKAPDLEGYLFPETYPLSRHTDAPALARLMVERFEHVLTPELRASASARGLSVRQLVTLASIVERETARADERPIVAAVYENRLRIGMLLQCDPTVIFALQRDGKYTGSLHHDDLMYDSPYNTYRYPGLPPGPIAAPGRASLEAAAYPAAADYLYFVSRNDGSHEFARTLLEHNRNVQKYQVQYFRNLRAGGAGRAGGASR